jgi:hypothetical protein
MKDTVKFHWEGATEHEAGIAVYEFDRSSYSLLLPNFRSAHLVYMALRDAYREGYEDGAYKTAAAVKSALSKFLEGAQ